MGLLLLWENLCNIYKYGFVFDLIGDQPGLTLSWRLSLSYRTHSIDLHSKSLSRFLHDRDIRHERVNSYPSIGKLPPSKWVKTRLRIIIARKVFKYEVISGPYFPVFGLVFSLFSVFSPNTGKCGPFVYGLFSRIVCRRYVLHFTHSIEKFGKIMNHVTIEVSETNWEALTRVRP